VTVNDMTTENEATTPDETIPEDARTAAEGSASDEADAARGGSAADDEPAISRAARKVREGLVVSNKMDKTAVVAVVDRVRHAKYNKFVLRTKKLYVHDETNDVNIGDKVRVMETRPLSKNKRWRVTEVLERAK
jgi:small subunit ribosomal protein S17